VPELANGGGL